MVIVKILIVALIGLQKKLYTPNPKFVASNSNGTEWSLQECLYTYMYNDFGKKLCTAKYNHYKKLCTPNDHCIKLDTSN